MKGKKSIIGLLIGGILVLTISTNLFAGAQQEGGAYGRVEPQNQGYGGGRGFGRVAGEGTYGSGAEQAQPQRATQMASLDAMPKVSLNTQDIATLLYIWEEEKLARDVYSSLAQQYNMPLFGNIARSEQTHMDQMEYLLTRYGLTVPVSQDPGIFQDPHISQAYTKFIEKGSENLDEAFLVGIAIEEMDIQDLEKAINLIAAQDVQFVLNQLLLGSQNHLAAFQRQAQR